MSFINGVKRAFGFSTDEDYDDIDDDVEDVDNGVDEISEEEIVVNNVNNSAVTGRGEYDDLADDLFGRIIDIINEPLPAVVRDCVDNEAQKRLIFTKLGDSLKSYMNDSVAKGVVEYGHKWEVERDSLRQTIADLEHKNKEVKLYAEEIENKGLSAERQKRTINERCQELEKRVMTLEGEAEQLQLLNKSLSNKVKVAQVKADDSESYINEIDRLKGEIDALCKANEELKCGGANAELMEQIQILNEKLAAKGVELELLQNELDALQKELDEANAGLEIVQEIQIQLEKVEELKASKDAKINSLNLKCASVESEKGELTEKIELLNATIRENLECASARELALNEEVGRLKMIIEDRKDTARVDVPIEMDNVSVASYVNIDDLSASADVASVEKRKVPKKRTRRAKSSMDSIAFEEESTPKISAIDESLDNLDWLVPSPVSEWKPAKVEDSEEETKEEPSAANDNSLQMSLF